MVKISIIIPCFNAARYLAETLDACFNQTFQDFEIICVNDGSTDETEKIISQYSERYPMKIKLITISNHGVSFARNLGTQHASAEWIQYLDADDLLLPQALEKKVAVAQKYPDCTFIYSNWQKLVLKEGAFVLGPRFCRTIEQMNPDPDISIFTYFWAPTAAYLYNRKQILAGLGWNEKMRVAEDVRFTLDLVLKGATFQYIPEILCYYREGHTNTLSQNKMAFVDGCIQNAECVEKLWREKGDLSPAQIEALVCTYLLIARISHQRDPVIFQKVVTHLEFLDDDFMRVAPFALKWAARVFGYVEAEALALKWRNLKQLVQNRLNGIKSGYKNK